MNQQKSSSFHGLTILIIGLGNYDEGSGISAVKFFSAHGADIIINDLKKKTQLKKAVEVLKQCPNIQRCVFGHHDISLVEKADVIFQNPSVPDSNEMIVKAREMKKFIMNDWTLFFLHPKARAIGITGTRGKSTTTSLIYEMMKLGDTRTKIAGNIGVSPLVFLDEYHGEKIVAEFSSWLLRGLKPIKKSPHIAVMTNIMNDHQNTYPSMKEYIEDKEQIFLHQTKKDILILNYEDVIVRAMKKRAKGKVMYFGKKIPASSDGVFIRKNQIIARIEGKEKSIINVSEILLTGEHNVRNVLASVAACIADRVAHKHIARAIRNFHGIHFRLERIAQIRNNVTIYNDTTATTPDAAIAGVKSLSDKSKVILIAGGADKKLDFSEWGKVMIGLTKAIIFLPGDASDKMNDALVGKHRNIIRVKTLKQALSSAISLAQTGDCILFSPGAASFNMFNNEFDRGEKFNALISQIK